jgi:hypothetical protein
VEYGCALQVAESEFPEAQVRGEPKQNQVLVVLQPTGSFTVSPTAPATGELTAVSIWLGMGVKTDRLAAMEAIQRRALKAVVDRCGQATQVSLSCSSSSGPFSAARGETCYLPRPPK